MGASMSWYFGTIWEARKMREQREVKVINRIINFARALVVCTV